MTTVDQIEYQIQRLTLSEQTLLLERLAHHIHEQTSEPSIIESQLEVMAADPAIQRELRSITNEFRAADEDGLADLP